jgi:hypothetical protein
MVPPAALVNVPAMDNVPIALLPPGRIMPLEVARFVRTGFRVS